MIHLLLYTRALNQNPLYLQALPAVIRKFWRKPRKLWLFQSKSLYFCSVVLTELSLKTTQAFKSIECPGWGLHETASSVTQTPHVDIPGIRRSTPGTMPGDFWECFPLQISQRPKVNHLTPPPKEGGSWKVLHQPLEQALSKTQCCRIYCPKFKGREKCSFWALEKAGEGSVCPWGGQVQLYMMRKLKGRCLQTSAEGWLGGAELLGQYLIQK